MSTRIAIYARNSKPPRGWKPSREGEEPPGSWKSQLDQLRGWATRQGYEIAFERHDMASGRDANRPGWAEIVAEARGHHVQLVVATRLDRVMRSVIHFREVVDEFLGLGVELMFLDTGMHISKRDAMSKFLQTLLAAVAELELDLMRERGAAVMERREDGRLYGPRSPRPSGHPFQYSEADGHKFRNRGGHRRHDKPRCRLCNPSRTQNPVAQEEGAPATGRKAADGGGWPIRSDAPKQAKGAKHDQPGS